MPISLKLGLIKTVYEISFLPIFYFSPTKNSLNLNLVDQACDDIPGEVDETECTVVNKTVCNDVNETTVENRCQNVVDDVCKSVTDDVCENVIETVCRNKTEIQVSLLIQICRRMASELKNRFL
jgi:hypothetical protein